MAENASRELFLTITQSGRNGVSCLLLELITFGKFKLNYGNLARPKKLLK